MKRQLQSVAFALAAAVLAFGGEGVRQDDSAPPELASFPTRDGGLVYGNLYGEGERAVVLAHGGRFTKENWDEQARALARVSANGGRLTRA